MNVICPAAVNKEFLEVSGLTEIPWKAENLIQVEDIAELVFVWVSMPLRIPLESIVVWPTCQAAA